jgi:membrane protein DedA with SNARE-associated domain
VLTFCLALSLATASGTMPGSSAHAATAPLVIAPGGHDSPNVANAARSSLQFDPKWLLPAGGAGLILAMAAIAVATLVSEDLTCIGTGIMIAHGDIGFWSGTLACFVGIVMGDCLFFALGRLLGRPVLERPPLSWIVRATMLDGAVAWFKGRGPVLVFVTRFLPGFRVPVYVAAGVLHTGAWTFIGWFFLAAALWTPALVWLSARSGQQMVALLHRADTWPALLLGGVVVFLLVRFGLPLVTARGRQAMRTRLERFRKR